ncbi:DUF4440 domain-containing protein [Bacillus sp. 165]|uniref:nuclear transport factor 2 family protein n=1 Tax=Bacillus sp. 165 TaxID=1529117 RepID=UPI001ADD1B29|nr:DUF4440 domain-containing protein [Bacillus sp. 165]MBO9129413.1 DUF4440 domain-containing protein [Bacillus sp. 165]
MTEEKLQQVIYNLECSHLKPHVRVSEEELSLILADDYFEFGSSGRVWQREDFKGEQPLSPDIFSISDFNMHVLSSDCVLTTYKIFNETRGTQTLRSSIWRKRDDQWKLFFHQGTKTS